MSMLSEQCDKLRKRSEEIRALQRMNSDWLWKDSALLVGAADALREAAATIESLRDRLCDVHAAGASEHVCELTAIDAETWDTDIREPVVRCRDCIHWALGHCHRLVYDVTNEYGDEFTVGEFPMDEADFCSLGERREADDA